MLLALAGAPLWAGPPEVRTLESAGAVLQALPADVHKCLPPAVLRDAWGVAVIPHVVKAGLVFDHRFGRGVLLARRSDGRWSDPVFVTLEGGGVGLEAGVEATDLVLVFRTSASVDRVLKGKGQLKLGADAAVAAGPLGRETEASTALLRKAEVYAYSHSRGLFAGLSLEGDHLRVDADANEAFYRIRGGHPEKVLARKGGPPIVEVERLKEHLTRLSTPPAPPAIVVPVAPLPLPGHLRR
jgi:lipid-binding SYLF domain-containing protein